MRQFTRYPQETREDILSETLEKALVQITNHGAESIDNWGSWLITLAMRRAISLFRHDYKDGRERLEPIDGLIQPQNGSSANDALSLTDVLLPTTDSAENHALSILLFEEVVGQLDDTQRLLLYYIHAGYSYAEITTMTGMKRNAINVGVMNGIKPAIRDAIAEDRYGDPDTVGSRALKGEYAGQSVGRSGLTVQRIEDSDLEWYIKPVMYAYMSGLSFTTIAEKLELSRLQTVRNIRIGLQGLGLL